MSTASQNYYQPSRPAPPSPLLASPFKKKNMSITQTYYLAHKARAKLSSEASRPDHNLRLLVGHANLLDSLMLELHDAEREQESWFNQSVRSAAKEEQQSPKPQHITWADQVIEEEPEEEDWEDSSSDDSSDDDEYDSDGDVEMADTVSLYKVASHSSSYVYTHQQSQQETVDVIMEVEQDEYEDDEEDYAQLTLTRSPSHSQSPPELDDDSDSEDDDSMPPSPPNPPLPEFNDKQAAATALFSPADSSPESSLYEHGFFPTPTQSSQISVGNIGLLDTPLLHMYERYTQLSRYQTIHT